MAWFEEKRGSFGWFRVKFILHCADFLLRFVHVKKKLMALHPLRFTKYVQERYLLVQRRDWLLAAARVLFTYIAQHYIKCWKEICIVRWQCSDPCWFFFVREEPWRYWTLLNNNWNIVTLLYLYIYIVFLSPIIVNKTFNACGGRVSRSAISIEIYFAIHNICTWWRLVFYPFVKRNTLLGNLSLAFAFLPFQSVLSFWRSG